MVNKWKLSKQSRSANSQGAQKRKKQCKQKCKKKTCIQTFSLIFSERRKFYFIFIASISLFLSPNSLESFSYFCFYSFFLLSMVVIKWKLVLRTAEREPFLSRVQNCLLKRNQRHEKLMHIDLFLPWFLRGRCKLCCCVNLISILPLICIFSFYQR